MLLENKQVAIIGGGPGGLTLARLLQLKGAIVKVYERDLNRDVRVQGATLDLHYGSGLVAMERTGLMDAFKSTYRPGADKGRVIDKHGIIVYDEHSAPVAGDFNNKHFRPEIDRGPLRNMLLDALQPGTIVWDSQYVGMSQAGDEWKLEFKNGTTAAAHLVIGADGANSKIRPFVTAHKPSYAGVTIVQGNIDNAEAVIPNIHRLLAGGKIYVHADGKFLHISSKGDGSVDVYVSFKADESWSHSAAADLKDRSQVRAWYNKEFAGWDNIWIDLFENVGLPLLIRPQYIMPFQEPWQSHRSVTLLGDAAHIMPPSGEGVNLAMLDAVELSDALTGNVYKGISAAIAAYEKTMWQRGANEAKDSLEMVEWMHAADAQDKMLQMLDPTGA